MKLKDEVGQLSGVWNFGPPDVNCPNTQCDCRPTLPQAEYEDEVSENLTVPVSDSRSSCSDLLRFRPRWKAKMQSCKLTLKFHGL